MYGSLPPSLVPANRRRRARLDQHASAQATYRKQLRSKGAPDREDFGRAALGVCLLMCRHEESADAADAIRKAIVGELVRVGFDRDQAKRRFWEMVERVDRDRDAWKAHREWDAERATEKGPAE